MLVTTHVETVCLLSKLHEAKHHVNVRLDMDEMDLTAAERKATYEEIKKYVAKHNDGMKVFMTRFSFLSAKTSFPSMVILWTLTLAFLSMFIRPLVKHSHLQPTEYTQPCTHSTP